MTALDARSWRIVAILLACVLLPGPAACGGERSLDLDEVRARGFIRAGYSDEAPYSFAGPGGDVLGESPAALRAAAARLGIPETRWVRLEFHDLLPALEQGRVDVLAAGIYRTAERSLRVRFTRPTSCSRPALVMRAGSDVPEQLRELTDEGATLAVLKGSVEEGVLDEFALPPEQLLRVGNVRTGMVAVERGRADAIALTAPTATWWVRQRADAALRVVQYMPPDSVADVLRACSALAFRPGDEALAAAVDSTLRGVLASAEYRAVLDSLGFSSAPARSGSAGGAR